VRRARIGDPFICVDIYIRTCRVRWLYIPADVPTRARDGDGRIVGARNRTHVCMGGGAAACTPIPISHTSTHIPTYIYMYV
jgi:hypothetical protein